MGQALAELDQGVLWLAVSAQAALAVYREHVRPAPKLRPHYQEYECL